MRIPRHPILRLAFAILIALAALGAQFWVIREAKLLAPGFLYPASFLVAWYLGFWPSVLTIFLGGIGANMLLLRSGTDSSFQNPHDIIRLCIFFVTSLIVARVIDRGRKAEIVRETFFELPDLMLSIAGSQGYFERVNSAWEKTLGYSQKELTSRPWSDFIHPDDVDASKKEDARLLRREAPATFLNRYRCRDGSYKWLHWSSNVVDGKIYSVARDVTGLKQIEEALRISEAHSRSVVSALQEGVVIHRATDGAIIEANPRACEILGLSLDQLLGGVPMSPHLRMIRPDGSPFPHDQHPFSDAIRTKTRQHDIDMGIQHADGRVTWILINAQPLLNETTQDPYAVVVSFTDITTRNETKEALKRAVVLRDDFLSIASHELRTPLTSLQIQTQMTLRHQSHSDAERMGKFVAQTDRSVKRLVRLVDDMLDTSRIASGRMQLRSEQFDLSELALDVTDRFRGQADAANVKLSIQASEPIIGTWDSFRIEQVLVNLLSNALRYGQGSPIEVTVKRVGATALLAVSDLGPGIPTADHERIFERFERGTSKDAPSGLGLGLFISREIAVSHGGQLKLKSEPEGGTRFEIELPLRRE